MSLPTLAASLYHTTMNPGLAEYRAAREHHAEIVAAADQAMATLTQEAIDLVAPHLTPKARAKLETPEPSDGLADLSRKFRLAWDATPKAQRDRLYEPVRRMGDEMGEAYASITRALRVVKAAAAKVEGPIVGDEWRVCFEAYAVNYASHGLAAESYARARATLKAYELREIGYEVRGVRALTKFDSVPMTRRNEYLRVVYRIEAKTTEEGARVARYQELWDLKRASAEAWSAGVNPGALFGYGQPYSRAGARGPKPAPIEWRNEDA